MVVGGGDGLVPREERYLYPVKVRSPFANKQSNSHVAHRKH